VFILIELVSIYGEPSSWAASNQTYDDEIEVFKELRSSWILEDWSVKNLNFRFFISPKSTDRCE
jgi:hypothetical protein